MPTFDVLTLSSPAGFQQACITLNELVEENESYFQELVRKISPMDFAWPFLPPYLAANKSIWYCFLSSGRYIVHVRQWQVVRVAR